MLGTKKDSFNIPSLLQVRKIEDSFHTWRVRVAWQEGSSVVRLPGKVAEVARRVGVRKLLGVRRFTSCVLVSLSGQACTAVVN